MAEAGEIVSDEQVSEQHDIQILGALDLDAHVSEDSLVDIVLNGQFKVEKFLRHDNHADVYSIRSTASQMTCLEARAYPLEGISRKVRQYRLRNIKRLSSRTVLETRWQGMVVMVYKAGGGRPEDSENSMHTESLALDGKSDLVLVNTKIQQKTDRRREMARIRQLERRKSNRRKERELKAAENPEGNSMKGDKAAIGAQRETDDEEALYILLHLAYSDRPQLRQQLPTASRIVLEKYLRNHDLKFEDDDEMEVFMKIKHHEVLFLGRQQKKMPEILKRRHDEFEHVLREQGRLLRSSKEYTDMQNGPVAVAHHRLKVIRNVCDILPKVIDDADRTYRTLKKRLSLARQKKVDMEKVRVLGAERERLKRKVAVYEKCSEAVVPASGPYAQVVSQLHAAEEDLRIFDARLSGTSINTLGSLQDEYEDLLAAPVKESGVTTQTLST
jgi:hypothetical protein